MDTNRISEINQALIRPSTPSSTRQVALPPPVAQNNVVRPTAPEPVKEVISEAELKHSVEAINRFLQPASGSIEFTIDEETDRTLVKVIDSKTQEVLRQMPSKEALAIAKELDRLQGLLIKAKA